MKRSRAGYYLYFIVNGSYGTAWIAFLIFGLLAALTITMATWSAYAATPGLPFTEDFSADNLKDASGTTANWSTAEQKAYLAWRRAHQNVFGSDTTGADITADPYSTRAIALGDVDGDGDLDVVTGNYNLQNRLYLSNGTSAPFNGVTGVNITTDAKATNAIALGDVDGDGDLDVVTGNNNQPARLYLNNGTANPFSGVTGIDITADAYATNAIALGDVDGDGDLDVVAGNANQQHRLYLNNGTANPFSGVTGINITADARNTGAIALGDVDGDGDLDVVAGNANQQHRLYLNNGTSDPFNGVTGTNISADVYNTQAIALGDMDGDGDLDVVAGNYGQTNRLYLNNGTTNPFSGVTGINITADARNTGAIALGDVDGDGDLDVVVGNTNQQHRLYLNNGTSDPFNGVTGTNITADSRVTVAIALGDMDNDGDPDMVAGNYFQTSRLYLNNSTSDPFNGVSFIVITADAQRTYAVALGDVDNDGDLDVVSGNENWTSRLYLNNGTSDPFSGVAGTDIPGSGVRLTLAIALGDMDGDGDLDVVTGNYNQANRLYLNNGTSTPFSGVTGTNISDDAYGTQAIALGDVDGDGDLDVVAAGNSGGNRLYLNNGTSDPFNGVTGTNITADAHNTYAIALGDVDNDGHLDVVAGNNNQVNRLYLNNGTPDPFNGVTGMDITADAHSTIAIALGDVDNDGDLDVVAGNYGQVNRLYLNNGTSDPFSGVTGTNITADGHNTYAIALADVDNDGDLDVAAGNFNQTNRLYLNNGTSDPFNGVTGTNITSDSHFTLAIALGDMDNDGDLDVVEGNYEQPNCLYLNNGASYPFNGISGTNITADAHNTYAIAFGDVDGDGDLDVVAGNFNQANRLYLNNNGTSNPFSGVTGTNITADVYNTYAIAFGDMDSDGDLDVVAGNYNQTNRLYLNNGTADPFNGVAGTDITAAAAPTRAIALADMDSDGDLDVVEGNYNSTSRLYLNNGTADPFSGVTGTSITADIRSTYALAVGDVDNDGDLDVVTGNYNQANRLYLNNGTSNPFSGVTGTNITAGAHATRAVALGDVDNDGDLDVVAGNYGQINRLYLNNGTSDPFNGVTGIDITSDAGNTLAIALADVDHDGDLDVVAGNSGANRLYLNNGTSDPFNGVTGIDITSDAYFTYAIAVGDVDGDGAMEIAAGNTGANRLYRTELYQTAGGKVRSLTVDTEAGNILNARLVPTATMPANTWIDWYLTNNGGAQWYKVKPDNRFIFPTTGSDLRWKAEPRSLSPHRTPVITAVAIDTDKTAPTVTLSTTAPDPTSSAFDITITLSEAVTGFVIGDITVGNGTASNFSGSGAAYTATINPSGDGQVTVNVASGVAQDAGGNGNTAATQLARTYDHTAPTTTASAAGYTFGNWTATSPVSVALTASDGSGSGVAAGYPKHCVDTANTCTPATSGASVNVTCATGSTCTQYVRYYSVDNIGYVETVKNSVVKQDLQAPVTTASPSSGPIDPSQSITLTCGDSGGAGCGTTLYCTGAACVPGTSYSAAITISADTILRFKSSDTLGNTETVKEESYTYDGTPPVFSALSPADGSTVNAATVGYTLSEVVSSGSVTFTWLSGTSDPASPHAYAFVASDMTAGSHSVNTALPLVSGAYYDITISAVDIAGNAAAPATISNVLFDSTSAVVTITSPAASSRVNTSSVSYTLSEELTAGDIVFTRTGGSADPASPHIYTLTAGDRTAGSHTTSTGFTLVNGAVYTVSLSNITDKAGNPTATVSNINVTFDSAAVVISNTTPAPNSMITSATAGYTLSEAAQTGKVAFTRTGGTADPSSPHVRDLTGSELDAGAHIVNTGFPLVEGAIYTVSFEATDLAGNPATAVSNASVTYIKLGDLDDSGDVTSSDALRALRIAAGLIEPTSTDLLRGDVAPLVNGAPQPDGEINIGDVVVILRKAVGLSSW